MEVLLVYEGQQGRVRPAVDAVADAAAARSVATLIRTISECEQKHFANADAVIVGCWSIGDTPIGGSHERKLGHWIDELPPLDGLPVGVFCAFKFFPHTFADTTVRVAQTLNELRRRFELRGDNVVSERSINTRSMEQGATALIDDVLKHRSAA